MTAVLLLGATGRTGAALLRHRPPNLRLYAGVRPGEGAPPPTGPAPPPPAPARAPPPGGFRGGRPRARARTHPGRPRPPTTHGPST